MFSFNMESAKFQNMFNQILAKIFVAHHPLKQKVVGDGKSKNV